MPLVVAHRGASALEVENSLAAFRRAVDLGAHGIELDVHATGDGGFVVVHDGWLDGHPLSRLPVDRIKQARLPNGETIPTLAEALDAIGSSAAVYVEVKTLAPADDERLLGVLAQGPEPRRYHVHAFDHRIIRRLRALDPGRVYGILSASYPVNPIPQLLDAGAAELWQQSDLIDRALVSQVHAVGALLCAWTVDDPARIRELRDLGVDLICTNRPGVAREALR